jgi:hypothetical protein
MKGLDELIVLSSIIYVELLLSSVHLSHEITRVGSAGSYNTMMIIIDEIK